MIFLDKNNNKHEAKKIQVIPHFLLREYLIEDLQDGDLIYCQPIIEFIEEKVKNINILPSTDVLIVSIPDFGIHSVTYLVKNLSREWVSFETTSPLQEGGKII